MPGSYLRELEKLRDRVPSVGANDIVAIIDHELPSGLAGAFASFEREPLAAASIGQVHAATLHDGTSVVVKVRKPGVMDQVTTDLEILADLARRAQRAELFGRTPMAIVVRRTKRPTHDYTTYDRDDFQIIAKSS